MAEHRAAPSTTPGAAPARADAAGPPGEGHPSQSVIYWRYMIFWLLFFGLVYLISLYGIVAEA